MNESPSHLRPLPTPAMSDRSEVAAGVLLRRWDHAAGAWLWLLLRNRKRGDWGPPKGHQEAGEDLMTTALRECAEETGIALLALHAPPFELVYNLPSGRPKRVVYYPATTAQHRVRLSTEHNAYAWLSAKASSKRLSHDTMRRLFDAHLSDIVDSDA